MWQLRQRAADLLAVAGRHGSFPVLLETYRECLQDVFDLPALAGLLRDARAGRIEVARVDLPDPSPFAGGLVFAYVAQFMYEGDAPLAERKAQALTLDRRMLAELLGTDELRELLDAAVLDRYDEELQGLAPARACTSVEDVADLLRRIGDLTAAELERRCDPPALAATAAGALVEARRAFRLTVAGDERFVAAEDVARYRDGLGCPPPPGVPAALLDPEPDAGLQLVRRWARTHGPFLASEPAARFALPPAEVDALLRRLSEAGRLVRGAFRPGGHGADEWCDTEVLRVLRQRSLAALRHEVQPVPVSALVRFLPAWHGVAAMGSLPKRTGTDRLLEVVTQLEGLPLPARTLEADILPARVGAYEGWMLDELLVSGEVMWAGAGSLGRDGGRVVLARREVATRLLPRLDLLAPAGAAPITTEVHEHIRATLQERGACFFRELGRVAWSDQEVLAALWDLVWAGEVTGDGFAALRALVGPGGGRPPRARPAGRAGVLPRAGRPRPGSIRRGPPPAGQGRWSLLERELGRPGRPGLSARADVEAAAAVAGALLDRHGVLTRDAVRAEGIPGGFAGIYPVLRTLEEAGRIRRGYFVAGMGAAQFARPGSVDRVRAADRVPDRGRRGTGQEVYVLAATDPAHPYGATIPWPVKGPGRVAGAYVVIVDGVGSAFVERDGRGLVPLRPLDGTWEQAAAEALGELVVTGRLRRVVLQRYPEEMVPVLQAVGFIPGPKGLVRYS